MLVNCNNRLSALDGKEIDHRQRDALIRFAQHRMNKKKRMKAQRQDNGANHPQHSLNHDAKSTTELLDVLWKNTSR